MGRRKTFGGLVCAVVLGLLVAGCGGGGASDDEAAPASSIVSPSSSVVGSEGDSLPTVKLMVMTPTGTGLVDFPESLAAAQAAARGLNEDAEQNGYKLEIVYCNEQNDPNQAESCARSAADQGVAALVGGFSQYGDRYLPILLDAKIAAIGFPGLGGGDFTSGASFLIEGGALGSYATCPQALADAGAKSVLLIRHDLAAAAGLDSFVANGAKNAGIEAKPPVVVPADTADYSTVIASAQSAGVDGVVVALPEQQATQLLQVNGQSGKALKICSSASAIPDASLEELGDMVGDFYTSGTWPATGSLSSYPEGKRFLEDMKAEVAAGNEDARIIKASTIQTYVSVLAAAQVLDKMAPGDYSAPAFLDAISTASVDLGFGLKPVNFAVPGALLPRLFNSQVRFSKWNTKDGHMVAVDEKIHDAVTYAK